MVKRAGIAISIVIVAFFALRNVSFAMGSDNYQIPWDSVNSGGEDTGSSTNYQLHDTIGEQATGFSTSTDYTLSAGYRVGDYLRNSIGFNVGTQENSTQIAYSSFSTSTKSVIVTDASGFAVDDLIGVVENQGLTENVAVGKIKHIVGNTLYVDA